MAPMSRSNRRPARLRSRLSAALLGAAVVLAPAAHARAAWTAGASGIASAASSSVPTGPTPTLSLQGRNVTVSWPATVLPGGDSASGYQVSRTGANGSTASIGASCDTVQAGLSCTEAAVAPGSWSYGVTARAGRWSGPQGPRAAVVVPSPSFAVSAGTPVTTTPGTVTGAIAGFVGPASLWFRLDDATSGQVLTGTPTTVPAGGMANVSVTVPAGVADGPHTIYAIGSGGDSVGASIFVDRTRPTPVSLVTADGGGTQGAAEAGDSVSVTFSEPLRASSICGAWADDGGVKTLTSGVTVTITTNGGVLGLLGADVLTVAAAGCTGGLRFGRVDLGGSGYISGTTVTFGATGSSSTVRWDPSTSTMGIVLGTASAGRPLLAAGSSTAVYTPDGAMTDLRGLSVTGTASRTARHL